MTDLLREELDKMKKVDGPIDTDFIDVDVNFFRTYADRTHHGKEEDILFKQLAEKPLSSEHRQMLALLTEEHKKARAIVSDLAQNRARILEGDTSALADIRTLIEELIVFYPAHIEKEDKHFFYPTMDYFSESELQTMLQQFRDFDAQMIHEMYQQKLTDLAEGLEE